MTPTTTLNVTGNSHVVALADGLAAHPLDARVFPLGNGRFETSTFSRVDPKGVRFTVEQYAANLLKHTGGDVIAGGDGSERWGFVLVNHNARVYRRSSWLTHEPAGIVTSGRQPVTQGLVRRVVERDQQGIRTFFGHLQQAGVDFFAISAPPPRRDHPAVEKGVRPEVIVHLDRTARQVWAGWLGQHDIAVVGPPAGCTDADGFLLPELASQALFKGTMDKHHANAAYGARQLRDIERLVRSWPSEPG